MPDYTEHYNLKKPKKTENYDINDVTRDNADLIDKALYEKVDKLPGKGLSTNDFTDNYKKKVDSLKNYDNTEVKEDINTNTARIIQLEQKKDMLSQQMPWNTTSGESIHIQDSAEWDENKLSLSGNMKQEKRSGKNKLDTKNRAVASKTVNGIAYTKNADGTFNLSGTVIDTANAIINIIEDLKDIFKKDTSYYFYCSKTYNLTTFNISIEITYTDNTTQNLIANKVTKTQNKEIKSVRLPFWAGKGTTIDTATNLKLMLVESTVIDNDYEEYGAMPSTEFPSMPVVATGVQKIRQFGENWFNKNNISKINAVVDISSIVANSSGKTFYIKIEPGTYTVSRKVIGARFVVGTTANIPKIGETIIDRIVNNSGSSITLTTSKNANYLVVYYLYNSSENEQEILDSIQIERGSTAATYKPYWEQIHTLNLETTELCAIKDTNGNVVAHDRAVYRNGKWQWEKNIKKMVLNGTEGWKNATTGTVNHFRGQLYVAESKTRNASCDKFVCRTSEAHGEWNYVLLEKDSIYINIANVELSEATLNGFKTWLSNNNVIVYYILATPEYTDCTTEQSTILDKLYNNFTLQKGTNNIIVETDNGVGVNMQLDYMQDLQTKLNLLEAMCVSNASQEV